MSPIKEIPSLNWGEHASQEIAETGQDLLDKSDFIWKVGEVAICGLVYSTFTSPPWFWFALAKGVTMRDLIDFRRLATLIPQGSLTGVLADRPTAIRFAQFYGFEDIEVVSMHNGLMYKIFRRA